MLRKLHIHCNVKVSIPSPAVTKLFVSDWISY